MVTNYFINTCKYRIDKLEKVVYLIEKESLGEYNLGEYYIDGGAGATVIKCNSISLAESSSLDERYQFTHTLTFQVDGYKTEADFNNRYYAIVKDKNGVYYLVNPDFKLQPTYTYTIDANGERTEFQLSTISNYPLMRVNNFAPWADPNYITGPTMYNWFNITPNPNDRNTFICDYGDEGTYECKEYNHCAINTIELNEKIYTKFCEGTIYCTNNGFINVDFTKNSATLTEKYDGTNIIHELKFTIPYDQMNWHNTLLDFNENTYSVLIKTNCDVNIACGFQFGFLPSYSIEGSTSETDKIEITLQSVNDGYRLVHENNNIPIIILN